MSKPTTVWWSEQSDRTYPSLEAMVEVEANGWIVTALITKRNKTWPWTQGPFSTQREANNARVALRRYFKNRAPSTTVKFFVRPAWKTDAERKKLKIKS